MNEINPIEILIHLFDVQYNRYNSYKEKISINISLASSFIIVMSIILPSSIDSIYKFYIYNANNDCINILHLIICIMFTLLILEYFWLFIFILIKSSKSLNPIKITTIDKESIKLWQEGKDKEACQKAISDLTNSIDTNRELINVIYENLLDLQNYFIIFIFSGIVLILYIVYIIIFVKIKIV